MITASLLSTIGFGIGFSVLALSLYSALSTGLLSLASITFAGCGGFLFAHATDSWDLVTPLALLGGAVVGLLAAGLVSVFLLHLESHYIAMATIALLLISKVIVLNAGDVTGGVNGMTVLEELPLVTMLFTLLLASWIFAALRRSRYGLAAELAREDPVVAATLGIDVRSIRRVGILLSGGVGGVAGAILASLYGYVDADTFYMDMAFVALAAVVLGGAYHWAGAVVGGIVFTVLPEVLRGLFDQADQLLNGLILILIMLFLPRGVVDPVRVTRWGAALAEKVGVGAAGESTNGATDQAVEESAVSNGRTKGGRS